MLPQDDTSWPRAHVVSGLPFTPSATGNHIIECKCFVNDTHPKIFIKRYNVSDDWFGINVLPGQMIYQTGNHQLSISDQLSVKLWTLR